MIILGAGAAGMMCAIEAGKRGRRVLLLDHAAGPGEKIRISGGGRCNFTNIHAGPANFLSRNSHFCVSALSRYTPKDFIALVQRHQIAFHEKTLGQLFCDGSSRQIIAMLLEECRAAQVEILLNTAISGIDKKESGFSVTTSHATLECASLVIATGGKSIPKMGASGFGYEVAARFGLAVIPPRPALVPLMFEGELLSELQRLSGLSLPVIAQANGHAFKEGMLFTHRGLSGPAILQISSYWREGETIALDLAPGIALKQILKDAKDSQPRLEPVTLVSRYLPRRLAEQICTWQKIGGKLAELADKRLFALADAVHRWQLRPSGSEGFRTAEVTLGGVDTSQLSSQSMECTNVPGLYFIGEVVDVTGHLGGFNFQWAWASGYAAGQGV